MTTVSEVSIPITVLIRNPVAPFKIIRELSIVATVPLTSLGNKNQGAEFYLVEAKANLKQAVNLAGVTMTEPEIESYEVLTDSNGDVYSIPMLINVRIKVGGFYNERVRIEGIEGNDYTLLDPNTADLETLIADIDPEMIFIPEATPAADKNFIPMLRLFTDNIIAVAGCIEDVPAASALMQGADLYISQTMQDAEVMARLRAFERRLLAPYACDRSYESLRS
ncbi:MAG: hypothetical protein IIB77_10925 [Proteobacteria bacterium]|nr:hypothetical protein [Pseudomonadota bacterium]